MQQHQKNRQTIANNIPILAGMKDIEVRIVHKTNQLICLKLFNYNKFLRNPTKEEIESVEDGECMCGSYTDYVNPCNYHTYIQRFL